MNSKNLDLSAIRTDYARAGLDERDLDPSPIKQLEKWLSEAIEAKHPEPTAMSFATAFGDDGAAATPAVRIVLLKGVDERGLVFFTSYDSDKGEALAKNPRASANLFWVMLERQIRVTGNVEKTSRAESEAYFATRPRESQLGAWSSAQSKVIAGRAELEKILSETRTRFGDGPIQCPPNWGGYRLVPDQIEFWQGRPSRLHDRLRYTRIAQTAWKIDRLAP